MDNTDLIQAMTAVALPNQHAEAQTEELPRRADLEQLFLSPSKQFSEEWLNKLQEFSPAPSSLTTQTVD
jgi:hypothetical protein